MGLWGAAQAIAFGLGGFSGTVAADVARHLMGSPDIAYGTVFAGQAVLFVISAVLAAGVGDTAPSRATRRFPNCRCALRRRPRRQVSAHERHPDLRRGGGRRRPVGATAAADLAQRGRSVLLLDRAGRIKPCGGAIPPRLIRDFAIPDGLLVARVNCARMVSPKDQKVDMHIEGGFVGMVDREVFDEWLRDRAAAAGAVRGSGTFERLERDQDGTAVIRYLPHGARTRQRAGSGPRQGRDRRRRGQVAGGAPGGARCRQDALRLRLP